jgi:hypothetical protein
VVAADQVAPIVHVNVLGDEFRLKTQKRHGYRIVNFVPKCAVRACPKVGRPWQGVRSKLTWLA